MSTRNNYTIALMICAAIALICFFLPFASIHVWGESISFSALNMAIGIDDFGIPGDATNFLFILPPIIIGAIAFVGSNPKWQPIVALIVSILTLILYFAYQSYFADSGFGIKLEAGFGYWLAIIAYLAVAVLSVLNLVGVFPKKVLGQPYNPTMRPGTYQQPMQYHNPNATTTPGTTPGATPGATPYASQTGAAVVCQNCGASNSAGAAFCGSCGMQIQKPY